MWLPFVSPERACACLPIPWAWEKDPPPPPITLYYIMNIRQVITFKNLTFLKIQIKHSQWAKKVTLTYRLYLMSLKEKVPQFVVTVWIKTNCGKFLKRWEYQTT